MCQANRQVCVFQPLVFSHSFVIIPKMQYCCEEKKNCTEWYKHAESMSEKLSSMSGEVQQGHDEKSRYEFGRLPRDLKKLTELRNFARKIWGNRFFFQQ